VITRNGDRLYVGEHARLAFLARHTYTNAWGWHCVQGAVFNLETGQIQRDAIAWCNIAASESEIVTAVMKENEG
jgi:hypothetical protein